MKYERKAKVRLKNRIASYEETCKNRADSGKGYRKPGSLKRKRN